MWGFLMISRAFLGTHNSRHVMCSLFLLLLPEKKKELHTHLFLIDIRLFDDVWVVCDGSFFLEKVCAYSANLTRIILIVLVLRHAVLICVCVYVCVSCGAEGKERIRSNNMGTQVQITFNW